MYFYTSMRELLHDACPGNCTGLGCNTPCFAYIKFYPQTHLCHVSCVLYRRVKFRITIVNVGQPNLQCHVAAVETIRHGYLLGKAKGFTTSIQRKPPRKGTEYTNNCHGNTKGRSTQGTVRVVQRESGTQGTVRVEQKEFEIVHRALSGK